MTNYCPECAGEVPHECKGYCEPKDINQAFADLMAEVQGLRDDNKKLMKALDAARCELLETLIDLHKLQAGERYSGIRAIARRVLGVK